MLKTKWRHNDQSSLMRRVFVWLHPASPGWWLVLLPRTLGSAAQVTSLHLAESCRVAELQSSNTMAPVLVREVRFRTHRVDLDLGMESWRGWWGSLAFLYLYSLRLVLLCDIHRICSSFSVLLLFCHDFSSWVQQNVLRTESAVVLYAELEPGWS